jgi:hypothetical protein
MSHPETLVIHRAYAGHSAEDKTGGLPVDRMPTETCFKISTTYHKCKAIHLHTISSFGERLNNKFLVLRPPSPHDLF